MIVTRGLCHVALPARDPEAVARFYVDVFGMEVLSVSPEAAFLRTPGRRDLLAFSRSDVRIDSSREIMHFGFVIESAQFDAALRTIEEQAIPKISEPGEREMGRYVFIEDPEGYTVEVFEQPATSG